VERGRSVAAEKIIGLSIASMNAKNTGSVVGLPRMLVPK
jgi:hypothetical protein